MTYSLAYSIPESVSFEDAIAYTQSLLSQRERGQLSEAEVTEAIARLVQNQPGTRGFFVVYLTDERTMADHPDDSILQGLRSGGDLVAEILLKNLAMSTAMVISHSRQANEEQAKNSERVKQRSVQLLQKLDLRTIPQIAAEMSHSATNEVGSYQSFYQRWGYDSEQRQAIQQALQPFCQEKLQA